MPYFSHHKIHGQGVQDLLQMTPLLLRFSLLALVLCLPFQAGLTDAETSAGLTLQWTKLYRYL